jgi:pyruvate dehydrogenase E2 component (dihydrolipoamide acetyltransferase)
MPDLLMPKLGLTMTEATLTEWLKHVGDTVRVGDVLFTFETDKSTLEFEAPADGVLTAIHVTAGQTVPVYTVVGVLAADEGFALRPPPNLPEVPDSTEKRPPELAPAPRAIPAPPPPKLMPDPAPKPAPVIVDAANVANGATGANVAKAAPKPAEPLKLPPPAPIPAPPPPAGRPFRASPRAKRAARLMGVDLAAVVGTGEHGRITEADVIAAKRAAPAATPLAVRLARANAIDLHTLKGTGRNGLITVGDVEAAIEARAQGDLPAPVGELIPFTGVRALTARRMAESASVPQVTLNAEANAEGFAAARKTLSDLSGLKVSYNALLVAICARALTAHPDLCSAYAPNGLIRRPINIGLAVQTERGLLVPVVRGADKLPIDAVQRTLDDLISRALAGKNTPEDFAEGTFTITNLGGFGVSTFNPLVIPPQVAILGVGKIGAAVVPGEGGPTVRQQIGLSLTFDHRAVDGAPAAQFLARVVALVEQPMGLLVGGV